MNHLLAYDNDANLAFYGMVRTGKINFETAAQMLLFGAQADDVDVFLKWLKDHPELARDAGILVRIPMEATFGAFESQNEPASKIDFVCAIVNEFKKLRSSSGTSSLLFNHVVFSRQFLLFWSECVLGLVGTRDLPSTPETLFIEARFKQSTTERVVCAQSWWYTSLRMIIKSGGFGVFQKKQVKHSYSDRDPVLMRLCALGCPISLLIALESDYYERSYCNIAFHFFQEIDPLFDLLNEQDGGTLIHRRVQRIWDRVIGNMTSAFGRKADQHFSSIATIVEQSPFALNNSSNGSAAGWTQATIMDQLVTLLKTMLADPVVHFRLRNFATIDDNTVVANKMIEFIHQLFVTFDSVSGVPRHDHITRAVFKHVRRLMANTILRHNNNAWQ